MHTGILSDGLSDIDSDILFGILSILHFRHDLLAF